MDRLVNLAAWTGVLLALAAGGCASVPLSTMWKMRNLTVDSFFATDPTHLRVALLVDRAMKRGPAQPEVEADVKPKGRARLCYAFALAPVDPSARSELVLEKPASNRAWSVFALSSAGIDAFKRASREVAGVKKSGGGEFNLGVTITNVFDLPDDAKSFPFRIDVALDRKDGYFTLIEETSVEIKRLAKSDKPGVAKTAIPPTDACPQT